MIARTAATRRCSASSAAMSVLGWRARIRAAPSVDVARSATRSSTRGNSTTFRAWEFTGARGREFPRSYLRSLALRARSRLAGTLAAHPSRCPAQLLFGDGADGAALGASLELRHHLSHHGADVARATG